MAQLGGGGKAPKIFSFLGAPTGIRALRVKGPRKVAPKKGPCRQGVPTDKGPLYRQGAPTDKELIHTSGPYRQGTHIIDAA